MPCMFSERLNPMSCNEHVICTAQIDISCSCFMILHVLTGCLIRVPHQPVAELEGLEHLHLLILRCQLLNKYNRPCSGI